MKIKLRIKVLMLVMAFPILLMAQQETKVVGEILDVYGKPISAVNISVFGAGGVSVSDSTGKYQFTIKGDTIVRLIFSHIVFKTDTQYIAPKGTQINLNIDLEDKVEELAGVTIKDKVRHTTGVIKVNPKLAKTMPSTSGGIEDIIKTLPGVNPANEMSSQYSVRGGNFDENLVYVNDIQVYRPFLVRSGQQEGLSFINPDMVNSVTFSAGGFEAKYGDKLSSVLDITYRKPIKFSATASASLLGVTGHFEGRTKNKKMTYQVGIRQKSNAYL